MIEFLPIVECSAEHGAQYVGIPSVRQCDSLQQGPGEVDAITSTTDLGTTERSGFAPAGNSDPTDEGYQQGLRMVLRCLKRDARTKDRGAAVSFAAEAMGRCERTVRRKIERVVEHGELGMLPKRPSNAGKPRVQISRAVDALIGDPLARGRLTEQLNGYIKSVFKSALGGRGEREVARTAADWLFERLVEVGVDVTREQCTLSRRRVRPFKHFYKVHIYHNDKRAWSDDLPRVRREWRNLVPMQVVTVDVHYADFSVTREDGTVAYPKLIAWQCIATHRLEVDVVLPLPNERIRKADIDQSFIDLSSNLRWGLPECLLFDHGKENGDLDQLKAPLAELARQGHSVQVRRARPYTPQSKPVENAFSVLVEQFQSIPGYLGSDRTRAKTQNQGKAPDPFPGSFDELSETIKAYVRAVNLEPRESLDGRSPEDLFNEHVERGWGPTLAPHLVVEAAFCILRRVRVRGDVIISRKRRFTHPELSATLHKFVEVAEPHGRNIPPLFRLPGEGWLRAEPEPVYDFLDPAGVRAGDKRRADRVRGVRAADKSVPTIDPVRIIKNRAAKPLKPVPFDQARPIDGGSALREIAGAIERNPVGRKSNAEARAAANKRQLDRIDRKLGDIDFDEFLNSA